MCGIGGIIKQGAFNHNDSVAAYKMLLSLTRRGTDAWGYFDGKQVYKEPGNFIDSPNKGKVMELAGSTNMFLCHTRAATTGDPSNNNNNHPLVIYPLVMAHNGIIYGSDPYDKPEDVEVDSYDLLYWIWYEYRESRDTVEAIRRGIKHIEGLYAVWLYNHDEKYVYLFRNDMPLVYTHISGGNNKIIVFASDEEAILQTPSAYSFNSTDLNKQHILIRHAKPNYIYKVHPSKVKVADRIK